MGPVKELFRRREARLKKQKADVDDLIQQIKELVTPNFGPLDAAPPTTGEPF